MQARNVQESSFVTCERLHFYLWIFGGSGCHVQGRAELCGSGARAPESRSEFDIGKISVWSSELNCKARVFFYSQVKEATKHTVIFFFPLSRWCLHGNAGFWGGVVPRFHPPSMHQTLGGVFFDKNSNRICDCGKKAMCELSFSSPIQEKRAGCQKGLPFMALTT